MNFDFLKDLVSYSPLKVSYVSNNLRSNFNFILEDHVKEKEFDAEAVTLLEKLHKVFAMFLRDELNRDSVYILFGNKLDLTKKQFYYLYDRTKEDAYINNLIDKLCRIMDRGADLKQRIMHTIEDENVFTNLSTFLIRECNNAAKVK